MYYDDNFGEYDINDPEDVEFYHEMQRSNVWKNCSICGRAVKIQPQYDKCDSCCRILERGGAFLFVPFKPETSVVTAGG